MKLRIAIALSSIALVLFGGGTTAAASTTSGPGADKWAAAPMSGVYDLRNFNSNKCLEMPDWSRSNGARAQQWDCVGIAPQRWYVQTIQWGEVQVVRLINAYSGKCLEVADWRTDNGAPVQQWDCVGIAPQEWWVVPNCMQCWDPAVRLVNSHSGKVLEIADSYRHNGAPAQQWADAGIATQTWFLR